MFKLIFALILAMQLVAANGYSRNPARLLAEAFREREPDGDCWLCRRDIAAARA